MIVIVPMLMSSTVKPNVLPGVCKMLEKYLIVYKLDQILQGVKKVANIKRVGSNLKLVEAGQKGPSINLNIGGKGGKRPAGGTSGTPKIDQALGLEPTWIKIELEDGAAVLGIKVVPFPVKSDENLINLMLKDRSMSFWKKTVEQYKRKAIRAAFRIIRGLRLPGISSTSITGDPKKDIIFAQTANKHNVFTLLKSSDIEDESFLADAGGIKKLFDLGWRSFVIADDTAGVASFCLEEFKGMCSTIPYQFIYASIGKDAHKVFEDLEDVKKAGGAFFRTKTNVKKVFGECMATKKLDHYSFQNEQVLTENLDAITNKFKGTLKSVVASLSVAGKKGNLDAIKKITSKFPRIGIEKIEKECERIAPGFKQTHAFSQKVIQNSIKGLSSDLARAASVIISFGSVKTEGDSKQNSVKSIKAYMPRARKTYNASLSGVAQNFGDTAQTVVDTAPDSIKGTIEMLVWAVDVIKMLGENAKSAGTEAWGTMKKWGDANPALWWVSIIIIAILLIVYLTRNE
ncbi:hypothetical protein KAR91_24940 [Candidatus Pacearchaeota archaeon]|nr:hypothetical protein [Candidatus Pacearchaeota archaeon]